MPTATQDADLILSNADGSTNLLKLNLWRDSPDMPGGWESEPLNPTPPPQEQGDSSYSTQSPEFGRVFAQSDWTGGFGEAKCLTPTSCDLYGYTDGVLAMFEGELVPSYLEDEVDAIVRNGRFETGDTTGWTNGTNVTVASSTDERSGTYGLSCTATANGGTVTQNYVGTDTVLQSREITAIAYVKRSSGSGTISLGIADGVGTTTSSTSTSSSFALLEVTRTINSSATAIKFIFTLSTDEDVFIIDDVAVILTGGSEFKSKPLDFSGSQYGTMGRAVIKWDESNDVWLPVYVDSTYEITGLESYESSLYAGRGSNNNYLTSTDGATWSDPSTNSGNNRLASFFTRVLNTRGDWALMKTRANNVSLSTSPGNTANWGAEIQVGDVDRLITSLTSAAGTAYVGREDGLWVYDSRINRFRDVEPDANFFPSTANFKQAMGRGGSIWASGGQQTFWRISPTGRGAVHDWEPLTHLIQSNAFKGFGGSVAGLAQDRGNVWIAMADNASTVTNSFPYTFPFFFSTAGISERVRIMTIRQQTENAVSDTTLALGTDANSVIHTVTSFAVSNVDQMSRLDDGTISSLFVMGTFTDSSISATDKDIPRVIRLQIPRDNENPRRANNIAVRSGGFFYTSWVDLRHPDVQKALGKLTILSKNFSASEKYVTVWYKKDNDTDDDGSGWTVWGDDGIFDTSPEEVKASVTSTPVTCTRIRLRIGFTTDSSSEDPPTVVGVVLHAVWNEDDVRRFRAKVKLTDKWSNQLRRVRKHTISMTDVTTLTTLSAQPFIQIVTPDGETLNATMKYTNRMIRGRVDALRGRPVDQTRSISLEFTEVITS